MHGRMMHDALSMHSTVATSAVTGADPRASLPYKQAAAAIGQGRPPFISYTEAFAWRNVDCAQVLLTREDIADRRRFGNARNTLLMLLSLGVIPIINENDTVAVDEIKFGDNDNLAALVAVLIKANLLLILSDVEETLPRRNRRNSLLNAATGERFRERRRASGAYFRS